MSAKGDGVELQPNAWSNTLIERVPQLAELAQIHTIPLFFEDFFLIKFGCTFFKYRKVNNPIIEKKNKLINKKELFRPGKRQTNLQLF